MKQPTRVQPCYYVYVIELRAEVLALGRFAAVNPNYTYDAEHPPLYVGVAGRSPEIRFEQHVNGYKASRYTRGNAKRLRMDLVGKLIFSTRAEAERMEELQAAQLRARGFAVWQN